MPVTALHPVVCMILYFQMKIIPNKPRVGASLSLEAYTRHTLHILVLFDFIFLNGNKNPMLETLLLSAIYTIKFV